ncbi:MAG: HAD-IA family hydrolase [Sphingomonas sp.]|nr:HAD-IA family hydrolase [Sphingomonas sp.]
MTKISFDLVGFDLDGTLVDSSADLAAATNHALASIGLPTHDVEEVKRFVGKGTRIMLERALRASGDYSEARLDALRPAFADYYDRHLSVHTRPYSGAVDALDALRERGVRVGLCTNKSERFTLPLLEELGLHDRFDAIVCGDTLGAGVLKPDPAPVAAMVARAGGGRSVFLGDTSHDIDAARGAGIASIAVRFGFVDAADELGADAILDHYGDLLPLLEKWPVRGTK